MNTYINNHIRITTSIIYSSSVINIGHNYDNLHNNHHLYLEIKNKSNYKIFCLTFFRNKHLEKVSLNEERNRRIVLLFRISILTEYSFPH